LSFDENHSDFHLTNLSASVIVDSSAVKVTKFDLHTQETSVNGNLSVLNDGLYFDIQNSSINTSDIL